MLGDLGLYIPLVLALSISGQVSLGATLMFSGVANIITGFTFSIPMCVQPMKQIAAVALANNLTMPQIMASGILTGAIVSGLGLTNLITVVNTVIPDSVVRGLQLGMGFQLFKTAMKMLPNSGEVSWDYDDWLAWNGFLPASLALAFSLVFIRSNRTPTALVLFFVGLIIAIIRLVHEDSPPGLWGVTSISVVQISAADWTVGLFQGAIPQVPTTLLNSCIAVCKLAEDLYPHRETGCNVRSVSVSVGLLNVVLCWFGALPICHGSGGLAGQHRFGARTNLSVLVLGALKLVLGLFFAPALLVTLRYFPTSILAAMLAISAFELASAARSALTQDADKVRLCLLTCCFTLFCGTAVGFLLGLVAASLLGVTSLLIGPEESVEKARTRWQDRRAQLQHFCKARLAGAPRHADARDV
jgi:MFS superfamily sulfate permease-like transporter